jgi:FMN-dependent oxidoreductase (nitrilotriacetate monooxygenase family)
MPDARANRRQDENMIALAVLIEGAGTHPAAWMHPASSRGDTTDINYYRRLAQLAERGKFDMFFVADTPAARTSNMKVWSKFPMFMNALEPVTLLSAVAGATTHIGLGATVSTSFFEPYNIARQFASLDHISGGRAAWNVVTSANDFAARNFGHSQLPPHAQRYARARESLAVVQSLWDTWDEDAFVYDKNNAVNFDPQKFHITDFQGDHFTVHGGLNVDRTPQGRPVIIQAGASEAGKEFAAETAEIVFGVGRTLAESKAFYDDLKGRMARYGREPSELKILSGMGVCVAATREEAQAKHRLLQDLVHPDVGKALLGFHLEVDLSDLPLDEPIPLEILPKSGNLHKAYFDRLAAMIRETRPTLRELYKSYDRGSPTFCGAPGDIADLMEEMHRAGAADGFMLTLNSTPSDLADFVELVVPELHRRGLFRSHYTGATLREHLGLKRPGSRLQQRVAS